MKSRFSVAYDCTLPLQTAELIFPLQFHYGHELSPVYDVYRRKIKFQLIGSASLPILMPLNFNISLNVSRMHVFPGGKLILAG